MQVWMTRPSEDAESAAEELRQLGYQVHCAPLMHIDFDAPRRLDLSDAQALLATSANGVRALLHCSRDEPPKDMPIFCVGDATSRTAKAAGFRHIKSAGGDVDDLARLVSGTLSPDDGPLVHIAGKTRAGDLAGLLRTEGFHVQTAPLYRATAAERLDDRTIALLKDGAISAVLLYSPRTARIYAERIAAHGLEHEARKLHHLCLSPAVAQGLQGMGLEGGRQMIAAAPKQHELFALLRTCGAGDAMPGQTAAGPL